MAPSGGPQDETPPQIVWTEPADEAVNVETDQLRLRFSEFVNEGSFARAFDLTPRPGGAFEIDWDGRTVTIDLPEALQENTTYLITLSTDLRDAYGAELQEPITLAFSTGPQINRGTLGGRVVAAYDGEGVEGLDVYAYAAPDGVPPDSLPPKPTYRTQTGEDGRFLFEYLLEQPYYVVALTDLNRNRRPDPGEVIAPPPVPALTATADEPATPDTSATPLSPVDTTAQVPDTTATPSTLSPQPSTPPLWVAYRPDAEPPRLERVVPLTASRFELRFDEGLVLPDTLAAADVQVRRAEGDTTALPAERLFLFPQDRRRLVVVTDSLAPVPYRALYPALPDTAGNVLAAGRSPTFTPPPDRDTVTTRFLGFEPEAGSRDEGVLALSPGEVLRLRFSQAVPDSLLRAALAVEDTLAAPREVRTATDDGTTYRLLLDPPLQPDEVAEVALDARVIGPCDTTYTQPITRLGSRTLGSLSGRVAYEDADTAEVVVQLFRTRDDLPFRTVRADADGAFLFADLAEGTYRFRAFLDRDGDGVWDGGRLVPYVPREPIAWHNEPFDVRPRWDNALPEPLRLH